MRTLDAYQIILNERTTLVLSASSNLLKLLTEGVPDMQMPPALPKKSADDPKKPVTGNAGPGRSVTGKNSSDGDQTPAAPQNKAGGDSADSGGTP